MLLSIPLLIGISFVKNRDVFFGIMFYLITILPTLPFIPFGIDIVAERFAYIPLLGLIFIAAMCFYYLFHRFNLILKISLIAFFIGCSAAFSLLTWNRCLVWQDSISLWSNLIEKHPAFGNAYLIRGQCHYLRGEFEKSIEDVQKGIRLGLGESFRGTAYRVLALSYFAINDYDKSLVYTDRYIKRFPNDVEIKNIRDEIIRSSGSLSGDPKSAN